MSMIQRMALPSIAEYGKVIQFDARTLSDFLETLVIIPEGEQYPTYSQYLHTYPDHQAITAKLCILGV